MADRILLDTSVLIAYYNGLQFEQQLFDISQTARVLFSVVTANELVRGAHDPLTRKIAGDFLDEAQGRLVTPSENQWIECGWIAETILKQRKRSKEGVLLLQNDILIALGAREAGATLVTRDQKDFGLLKDYVKIPIEFW